MLSSEFLRLLIRFTGAVTASSSFVGACCVTVVSGLTVTFGRSLLACGGSGFGSVSGAASLDEDGKAFVIGGLRSCIAVSEAECLHGNTHVFWLYLTCGKVPIVFELLRIAYYNWSKIDALS